MSIMRKWFISEEEKEKYINILTNELVTLRTKSNISQEELANILGVTRQTYGAIERRIRKMSWNTYLSLIMFFDNNVKTHQLLRVLNAFPADILKRFNDDEDVSTIDMGKIFGDNSDNVLSQLDDAALHSIRTLIMIEYARCTQTPGDAVIKSFDGISFKIQPQTDEQDAKANDAIEAIRQKRKNR